MAKFGVLLTALAECQHHLEEGALCMPPLISSCLDSAEEQAKVLKKGGCADAHAPCTQD